MTKLSKAVVAAEPFATDRPRVVLDAQVPGFGLLIGKKTKSFFLQRDIRDERGRRTVRRSLGKWTGDGNGVTVEEARRAALDLLAVLSKGIDPKEEARKAAAEAEAERARGMTLRQAIVLFNKSNGKGGTPRAERTVKNNAGLEAKGYLADWMDRPLSSIKRLEAFERHQALPQEIVAGKFAGVNVRRNATAGYDGRATANDVFQWFKAVYNRAMLLDETLPPNPCVAVAKFKLPKPRTAIPSTRLAAWHAGVMAVANPIRRDYLLFVLFSGLRRESAAAIRWEHVDFERRVLRVPKPKGGEERAFDLPLSDYLVKLLQGRRDDNPRCVELGLAPEGAEEWVWPSFSSSGHVANPREEIEGVKFTIHDLRRTFTTVAESLDVSPYAIKALLNHSQPRDDVTGGYITIETERLRAPMQRITDQLLVLVGGK